MGKRPGISIWAANRGVERNKKPLSNIVYDVKIAQLKDDASCWKYYGSREKRDEEFEKYKFKDLGYITVSSLEEKYLNLGAKLSMWHLMTPEELRKIIGDKQWGKFCQGKRRFIVQRRIDGRNIPKNK